jgi:hypothetical protein
VLGGEPAFTSCHGRVIDTLDYIWFTPMASRQPCGGDVPDGAAGQATTARASGSAAAENGASNAHGEHMQEAASQGAGASPAAEQAEGLVRASSGAAAGSGGGALPDWELVATRVALVPPLSAMRGGMPSPDYPSDHISLVAEFVARPLQGLQARAQPSPHEQGLHAATCWPAHPEQQRRQVNLHLRFGDEVT